MMIHLINAIRTLDLVAGTCWNVWRLGVLLRRKGKVMH